MANEKKKIRFTEYYAQMQKARTPLQDMVTATAMLTNRSENAVRQWGLGMRVPDRNVIEKIAGALDCDPDYLFATSENQKAS